MFQLKNEYVTKLLSLSVLMRVTAQKNCRRYLFFPLTGIISNSFLNVQAGVKLISTEAAVKTGQEHRRQLERLQLVL